jgi:hypothetical protein
MSTAKWQNIAGSKEFFSNMGCFQGRDTKSNRILDKDQNAKRK